MFEDTGWIIRGLIIRGKVFTEIRNRDIHHRERINTTEDQIGKIVTLDRMALTTDGTETEDLKISG